MISQHWLWPILSQAICSHPRKSLTATVYNIKTYLLESVANYSTFSSGSSFYHKTLMISILNLQLQNIVELKQSTIFTVV